MKNATTALWFLLSRFSRLLLVASLVFSHPVISRAQTVQNKPPVLYSIGNRSIVLGETLTLTVTAYDPEGGSLRFSVSGMPPDASLDPDTQLFSWTPTAAGVKSLTFSVSDPLGLSDSETITVTSVANPPGNQAPILEPIGNKTLPQGEVLWFSINALDPDRDYLTFTATGTPAGAEFQGETFMWFDPVPGNYSVRFTVSDGTLTDSETILITVNAVLKPAAPSNMTASLVTDTESGQNNTVLQWQDNSNNENLFYVYGSSNGTDFERIARAASNVNPSPSTVTPLTLNLDEYKCFKVLAYNAGGLSDFSNVATLDPASGLPVRPTNLGGRYSGNDLILGWKDNSMNEDGYAIETSADGTTFTELTRTIANVTCFEMPSMTIKRSFRVRAFNELGYSQNYTNTLTVDPVAGKPAAPTDLAGTLTTVVDPTTGAHKAQVTLNWKDNSTNETDFLIEYSEDNIDFYVTDVVAPNITTYVVPDLRAKTWFRVSASNFMGSSALSNTVIFNPLPEAPANLTGYLSGTTAILTWRDNSTNETGFNIEKSTAGDAYTKIGETGANITRFETELTEKGYFRVSAFNRIGSSSGTNTVKIDPAPQPNRAPALAFFRYDDSGNEVPVLPQNPIVIQQNSSIMVLVTATDPDKDPLTLSAENMPEGAWFSSQAFFWFPSSAGTVSVRFKASDGTLIDTDTITFTVTAVNPAVAPTNLTAKRTEDASKATIILTWSDNSSNEYYFLIESSDDGTDFKRLTTVKANTTTFSLASMSQLFFRVQAFNQGGGSAFSNVATVSSLAPPTAPSGLRVNLAGAATSLAWVDNSDNEDGFAIETSADGLVFAELRRTAANITSLPIASLNQKTYFRVRAFNLIGFSQYSNVAQGDPMSVVPASPTGLVGTISGTTVTLTWTDNSTNETGFSIQQSADGAAFSEAARAGANTVRFQISGLTGRTYFKIQAVNQAGASSDSNTVTVTPPVTIPAAPSTLGGTISGMNVTLGWRDNSVNETGFYIESSTNGTTFTRLVALGANIVTHQTSCQAKMYFRVQAYNAAGVSAYSNVLTIEPVPGAPIAPTGLLGTLSGMNLTLVWRDNSTNETGFKIESSKDGITFTALTTLAANITTFQISNLTEKTFYRVKAYNAAGDSVASNITAINPLPAAPYSLLGTLSGTNLSLTWRDTSTNEAGFKIESSLTGITGSYTELATLPANSTAYQVANLAARTYFRVKAYNAAGEALSNAVVINPLPTAPSTLAGTLSGTNLSLTWRDNSTNEAGFSIETSTDGRTFAELSRTDANVTAFQATLTKRTYFRVRSFNAAGVSPYSNIISADPGFPAAPNSLLGTLSGTNLSLIWRDNSTNETGFIIETSTNGSTFTELSRTGANVTTFQVTNLTNKTYFKVQAFNTLGVSEYSNVLTVDPVLGIVPAAPSNLALTAAGLSWRDNSTNETGFYLESSTDGTAFTRSAAVGANIVTYQTTCQGKMYFRVQAYNTAGVSPYSNVLTVEPLAGAPAAPSGLVNTTAGLVWRDNSTNETGFYIESSTDGNAFTRLAAVGANIVRYQTSYQGKMYFRVQAYNTAGVSAYSNVLTVEPVPGAPIAPSGLVGTLSGMNLTLVWRDNSTNETGFKIESSKDGITFTALTTLAANITTFQVSNLTEKTFYRVKAYNAVGDSVASNITAINPLPAAPYSLLGTLSGTNLSLTWRDTSTNEAGFKVESSLTGITGSYTGLATLPANSTTYQVPNLAARTYFRVKAYNAAGETLSNAVVINPLPTAPSTLAGTLSGTNLSLTWRDTSTNEAGFKVESSLTGITGSYTELATLPANSTAYQVPNLAARTYFRVKAYNAAGEALSNAVVINPLPTAPSTLTGTLSGTNLSLTWRDNSTNEAGFSIETSTDGRTFTELSRTGANITAFQATLTNRTYFRVRSFNAAGVSTYSNTVSVGPY